METILAWDSKSHGGTMPEGYLHLTCEQRCQICALLQSGHERLLNRDYRGSLPWHLDPLEGLQQSMLSDILSLNRGVRASVVLENW